MMSLKSMQQTRMKSNTCSSGIYVCRFYCGRKILALVYWSNEKVVALKQHKCLIFKRKKMKKEIM
jgi:hypothetical protein